MYRFSCEHQFAFPWARCPRLQLLNYMVSACWVFKETAKLSSRAAAPLSFPGSEQPRFSAFSPACGAGTHVYFNPDRHVVIACGFTLPFPNGWWCWTCFHGLIFTIGTSFAAKCLFMFAHSQIGLFLLLLLSVESSLHVLDTRPWLNMWFAKVFSQQIAWFLSLPHTVFCRAKVNSDELKFISFF